MVQNGLAVDTPSPSSVTAQQEDNTLWVHTLGFQDMESRRRVCLIGYMDAGR